MIYFDLFESKKELIYENCDEFFIVGDANLVWKPHEIWSSISVVWGYGEPTTVSFYKNYNDENPTLTTTFQKLWKDYFNIT